MGTEVKLCYTKRNMFMQR